MNEQLLNANAANATLADINSEMNRIADLARAYANATPEQRANVDTNAMQAQLNRYNQLKAQRQVLYAEQEARVQAELEAQRQAAQQAWVYNGGGQKRRVVTPTPTAPIVPEVQTPSNIVVAYTKTWVPYYLDTTTWLQVAPVSNNVNGTVWFANWQQLSNIQPEMNEWINRYWTNAQLARDEIAARQNAENIRNQNIAINMAAVPAAMWLAEGLVWAAAWTPAGWVEWAKAVRQATNNWWSNVMSNPSYSSLATKAPTNVYPAWINTARQALGNWLSNVMSNPAYSALATKPLL